MYETGKYLLNNYKKRYDKVIEDAKKYSIGVKVKEFIKIGFSLFKLSVIFEKHIITNFQYFQDSIFFFNQAEQLISNIKYTYEAGPEEWTNILKGKSMINFFRYKTQRISKEEYIKNDNIISNQLKDYEKNEQKNPSINLSTIKDIDKLYDQCKNKNDFKPFLENIFKNLPSNGDNKININIDEYENNM